MQAPQAFDLRTLSDAGSFRTLWHRATWLGDQQELRRDHCALQKLIQLAMSSTSADDRRSALDLVVELFLVHADVEMRLPGIQPPIRSIDYATTLIELLNETPEDDPLFAIRAGHVLQQLSILMAIEEDSYDGADRRSTHGDLNGDLLQHRERLLRDVDALVCACGSQEGPAAPLNQRC